jgi:hypothetical protein
MQQTGITSITIENFKGIGQPVRVPLRPITLLFGANSAGKSTIIQALHYARELVARNNPDADLPVAGGNAVDLGGFRSFVHMHDLSKPIRIAIEVVPEPAFGLPRLWDPLIASKAERTEVWDSNISHLVQSVGVELLVRWSAELRIPWLSELNISYNGTPFASVKKEFPEALPFIYGLDAYHDFLEPLLVDNEHDTALYEFSKFLRNLADDSGRVKLEQRNVVPALADKLPIDIPAPEHDQYEGFYFWGNIELVNQLIHGPVLLLHRALSEFRYLGPIRVVPQPNHRTPKILDESRWADGSAAWDLLLKHHDPGSGGGDDFVKTVSQWLADEDKMDLGYSLDVVSDRFVPETSMLMANLKLLRDQFEEKDQEFYRRLVWAEIENARTQPRLALTDLKNQVSVGPNAIGVGVIQVLPVVVGALDSAGQLVAIEQPELHLHPRVACKLGDLFIAQAAKGKSFLIESHSQHLMLRIKRRIRENKIRAEDVSVLFVEAPKAGGRTSIIALRLDSEGEFIDGWPGGFFEEGFAEIFEKAK